MPPAPNPAGAGVELNKEVDPVAPKADDAVAGAPKGEAAAGAPNGLAVEVAPNPVVGWVDCAPNPKVDPIEVAPNGEGLDAPKRPVPELAPKAGAGAPKGVAAGAGAAPNAGFAAPNPVVLVLPKGDAVAGFPKAGAAAGAAPKVVAPDPNAGLAAVLLPNRDVPVLEAPNPVPVLPAAG